MKKGPFDQSSLDSESAMPQPTLKTEEWGDNKRRRLLLSRIADSALPAVSEAILATGKVQAVIVTPNRLVS
jgi:hypothetical protein